MGDYGKPGFLNINVDNQWPGFQHRGLELGDDGALRLFRLPRLEIPLPSEIENAPGPVEPGGMAVASDGSVYYGAGGRLTRIDGCSGQTAPASFAGTILAAG